MSRDVPRSTYRIQLAPDDDLDALAAFAPHLADLGVTHAYLSPVLASAPGSRHGYDTIDHSRIDGELGGSLAWVRAADALRARGIQIVLDIVPNHMAIPVPESLNPVFWDILRQGPESQYAAWVDVTWREARSITLPILGDPIDVVLDAGELTVDEVDGVPIVRYFDHVLPVRPGSESLPLEAMLDRQHYRIAHWEVGREELDYRRFFDVDTLVGVRVENDAVFDATHDVVLRLVGEGAVAGLRVDHVDGLADPRRYLQRLAQSAPDAWIVVEKILLGGERVPGDWRCAGTTGYDALHEVGGLFVDPAGESGLREAFVDLAGVEVSYEQVVLDAKREILLGSLAPELDRLAEVAHAVTSASLRLRDHTRRGLHEGLAELLTSMSVYRAYVTPGEPASQLARDIVTDAADAAIERNPHRRSDIHVLTQLALGDLAAGPLADEFCIRFQQTCGPVMAKAVEDTAFYRWFPLASLGEVGGDAQRFGVSVDDFHSLSTHRVLHQPDSMVTLTTHDTKRSEDVRARLALLSEIPAEWARLVRRWRDRTGALTVPGPDGLLHDARTEYLLWQTVFGAWPISEERLLAYAAKATREAGDHTSWEHPAAAYEDAVARWIARMCGDALLIEDIAATVGGLHAAYQSNSLSAKLISLTMPGVPDIYQGTEGEFLTLVDPDNRAPRDAAGLAAVLTRGLSGISHPGSDPAGAKARVTTAALRLRRARPEWFSSGSTYRPLSAHGERASHFVGFARASEVGSALVMATRLPYALRATDGWGETSVSVSLTHGRQAVDLISGSTLPQGKTLLADVLREWPVALVVDHETAARVWA